MPCVELPHMLRVNILRILSYIILIPRDHSKAKNLYVHSVMTKLSSPKWTYYCELTQEHLEKII